MRNIYQLFAETQFSLDGLFVSVQYDFFAHPSINIYGLSVQDTITSRDEGYQWLRTHNPNEAEKWDRFHSIRKEVIFTENVLHSDGSCDDMSTKHHHILKTAKIPHQGVLYPSALLIQEEIDGTAIMTVDSQFDIKLLRDRVQPHENYGNLDLEQFMNV